MATALDTRRIRRSTPSQLSDYFKILFNKPPEYDVPSSLLELIECGSIPPFTFATWLGVSKSSSAISLGLRQKFSVIVRKHSIKHICKALRSSRWKHMWDCLGGTPGLLDILSDLSVNEVREVCKSLARCGKGEQLAEKRECINELFMSLQPHVFPDAPFKTTDKRPLAKYYRHLIPSCKEDVVERIITGDMKSKWKPVPAKYLMIYHPDIVRREQLRALDGESGIPIDQVKFKGLLNQFPNVCGSVPGFSASMEFALNVLQQLVHKETSKLEDDIFINDLIRPLLRRTVNKLPKWSKVHEIVDLMLRYLEKYPYAGKEISTTNGDVLHLVALGWARKPDLFEGQLRKLCSDPVFGTSVHDEPTEWDDFLIGIPPKQRHSLLRLCFQESTGLDIENEVDLRKVKGRLSDTLLGRLRAQDALKLFINLRTARGNEGLLEIQSGSTVIDHAPTFGDSGEDLDLCQVTLLNRNGDREEAHSLATRCLETRKKKSELSSTPEQRAFYAKSALFYAIASGDLQLYQSILNWTKRFVRDPLVLPELYSSYPCEVVRILSGVPEALKGFTSSDIRARVESGNAILKSLFETAVLALGEPSFKVGHWRDTLRLFQSVVQERIDTSEKLKKALGVSDEDMYNILWEDTVEMLLSVEENANRSGLKRLEADSVRGPLDCVQHPEIYLRGKLPSTYTFLDRLAKARDQYWQKLRPTVFPTVLTLPNPFPPGLPIQHLTAPYIIDAHDLEAVAPYIASRTKAVVFPESTDALLPVPTDKDSTAAIGTFVDSYQHALRLYIPNSCNEDERRKRISKAWKHAIGPLSESRMNEEEALQFWLVHRPGHIKDWPPAADIDAVWDTGPAIPVVDDSSEPHEWNPFAAGPPDIPARQLGQLKHLDLSLIIHQITPSKNTLHSKLLKPKPPKVPAKKFNKSMIWHRFEDPGEGVVLSALLYLELVYGTCEGRLLEKPFPSAEDYRYPSLYIDTDFDGSSLRPQAAVQFIRDHLDTIPPALLHLCARNMMGKLQDSDQDKHGTNSDLEMSSLTLIMCLAECDKPALARKLVVNTILDRPGASSWHRQLLHPSFLRRLSAAEAQACFEEFADVVLERMQDKKSREKESTDAAGGVAPTDQTNALESSTKSYVKVTTIKLLAQLLCRTEFVSEDLAFSVLSHLLEKATHVDVRLNVTKTLLSMLSDPSPELAHKSLVALESVVPFVGNLNEREPLTEDDWKNAEEKNSPPDYPSLVDEMSPIFTVLLDHYCCGSVEAEWLQPYLDCILLPTLDRLKQQTARWISIFSKKRELEETDLHVPPIPLQSRNLISLLRADSVCYVSHQWLEEFISYVLFNFAPPPSIRIFNEKLRNDPSLRSQPDVQTWLSLYGQGVDTIETFKSLDIFKLFDKPTRLPEDTGITPRIIQEQFLKIFNAMVEADAPLYARLTDVFLANILNGTYVTKSWWPTYGKPILSAMIAYVNSLRTRDWEREACRTPAMLPDTFPWRLSLLDYPWPENHNKNDNENKCKTFAGQLITIIDEISGGMYHTKLEQIKAYLALNPTFSSSNREAEKKIGKYTIYYEKQDHLHGELMCNRALTAVYLGDITKTRLSWVTMPEVLRVEVAAHLMDLVEEDKVDVEVKERSWRRVAEWKECENEDVRRMGWKIGENWEV